MATVGTHSSDWRHCHFGLLAPLWKTTTPSCQSEFPGRVWAAGSHYFATTQQLSGGDARCTGIFPKFWTNHLPWIFALHWFAGYYQGFEGGSGHRLCCPSDTEEPGDTPRNRTQRASNKLPNNASCRKSRRIGPHYLYWTIGGWQPCRPRVWYSKQSISSWSSRNGQRHGYYRYHQSVETGSGSVKAGCSRLRYVPAGVQAWS